MTSILYLHIIWVVWIGTLFSMNKVAYIDRMRGPWSASTLAEVLPLCLRQCQCTYLFSNCSLTKSLLKPIETCFSKETSAHRERESKFSVVQACRYLGLTKPYRLSPGCVFFLLVQRLVPWTRISFVEMFLEMYSYSSENPKCIQVGWQICVKSRTYFIMS